MGVADDILTILFSYSAGYKRLRQLTYGGSPYQSSDSRRKIRDETLRSTLSRMRKNKLVSRKGDEWVITAKGKAFYRRRREKRKLEEISDELRSRKKSVIIAFDVPEERRVIRAWLRRELVFLGFEPIQKSVWFGPGPLPEIFIQELGDRDLLGCLKFFRATEDDVV
ncbi:hypothetical protein CL629_01505 [bacterium]|nr:hypothetical protein [bacterium]